MCLALPRARLWHSYLEEAGGGTHRSKSSYRDDLDMLVTCSPCSSLPWASLHPSEAGQAEPASLLLASSVVEALVFHGSFSTGLEPGPHPVSRGRGSGGSGPKAQGVAPRAALAALASPPKSRPKLSFCLRSLGSPLEGAVMGPSTPTTQHRIRHCDQTAGP